MTTTTDTRPLAAYLRVSTHGQAESGIGIAAQRQSIEAAATAHGFTLTDWYTDAGKSGSRAANRPGLQAALTAIRKGDAGGLVVAKIDRLGRSSIDVLKLVEQARQEGWRLVALDCGLDTTTPAGEMVVTALAMAARFEWRRSSERQREKHDELRRQGRVRGHAPAPHKVARRILQLRERGETFRSIAAALNAAGTPTVRGGVEWRASSVRSALVAYQREQAARGA